MNLDKEYITELVKQILGDIELEYFEDKPFFIRKKEEDLYDFMKNKGIEKPWTCVVKGPDYQFGGEDGGYVFTIDDESPNTIFLMDASGGQVPNSFIKKDENGKYYREYILR